MGPLLKTRIFIPLHKQSLFMVIFEETLINSYQVIPLFGPTSEENTCEIKFKYMKENVGPSSMAVDTKMAKRFVKEHLHILEENSSMKKRKLCTTGKQIIDLDDENIPINSKLVGTVDLTKSEPEVIILDDSVHQLNESSYSVNEVSVIDLEKTSTFSEYSHKSAQSEIEVLSIKNNRRCRSQSNVSLSSSISDSSEVKVLRSTFKQKPIKFVSNSSRDSSSAVHHTPVSKPTKRMKRNSTPIQKKPLMPLVSPTRVSRSPTRSKRKVHNFSKAKSPLLSFLTSPQPENLSDAVQQYYKGIFDVLNKKRKKSPPKKAVSCKQLNDNKRKIRTRSQSRKQNRKGTQEAIKQNKDIHRLPNSPITRIQPNQKRREHKTSTIGESNVFNPNPLFIDMEGLRPIVIDGSNIAVQHGKGKFSVKGVKICIDYFASRGHRDVKVFLPQYRQEHFSEDLLKELRGKCDIVFTPSRCINGVRKTSYDDRFIVQYAVEFGGVIVSTDNFRDLLKENRRWRETIHKRLLMFTWVDDFLMFPVDPLGRSGPTLEQFLKF